MVVLTFLMDCFWSHISVELNPTYHNNLCDLYGDRFSLYSLFVIYHRQKNAGLTDHLTTWYSAAFYAFTYFLQTKSNIYIIVVCGIEFHSECKLNLSPYRSQRLLWYVRSGSPDSQSSTPGAKELLLCFV